MLWDRTLPLLSLPGVYPAAGILSQCWPTILWHLITLNKSLQPTSVHSSLHGSVPGFSPLLFWQAQLQPRRLAGARCFIQWWDQRLVHKEVFQSKAAAPSTPWLWSRSHHYPITVLRKIFKTWQCVTEPSLKASPTKMESTLSTVCLINWWPHVPRTVWYRFSISIH